MENIEDILRALAEEPDEPHGGEPDDRRDDSHGEGGSDGGNSGFGGLFDGLDADMLLKLIGMLESMNRQDDNERFLLALKPLLREENRAKIDAAVKFLKLFALLPVLKESGLLGRLL